MVKHEGNSFGANTLLLCANTASRLRLGALGHKSLLCFPASLKQVWLCAATGALCRSAAASLTTGRWPIYPACSLVGRPSLLPKCCHLQLIAR